VVVRGKIMDGLNLIAFWGFFLCDEKPKGVKRSKWGSIKEKHRDPQGSQKEQERKSTWGK